MSFVLRRMEPIEIEDLISSGGCGSFKEDECEALLKMIQSTNRLWVAIVDGDLICIWGLVPIGSMLTNRAYLWSQNTETFPKHIGTVVQKLVFMAQSRYAMQDMLAEYPVIVGDCIKTDEQAIGWLSWLGAQFGEVMNNNVPFEIRKTR